MPDTNDRSGRVTVVGVLGDTLDSLSEQALAALREATTVAGGQRHMSAWRDWHGRVQPTAASAGSAGSGTSRQVTEILISDDAAAFARAVAGAATAGGSEPAHVVVLASGDPGFFGVVRSLSEVIDRDQLLVLPSPSSVSVAFARLGIPWDDAVVVSAHGRPLADAVTVLRHARKAAVLTAPDQPPEAVGTALVACGAHPDLVAVCSRLGCSDESVTELDLDSLACGTFDPLSVVVILGPGGLPGIGYQSAGDPARATGALRAGDRVLAWGLPESAFSHRGEMVTKAEVRAVALGKLELPAAGVLWDIGAGSASVAVECALLAPGLTVFAVESEPDDASRAAENASAHGVAVHVIEGRAPAVLDQLPDPDRVFVGGGGIEVLDAALARLRPGGRVVATFAALERAAAAADRLGSLVQVSAARGSLLPSGGWRLSGANPVFVVWGPEA